MDRYIVLDREFELSLDEAENRKFPAGWTGRVTAAVAAAIVAAGAGRIDADREAEAAEKAKAETAKK